MSRFRFGTVSVQNYVVTDNTFRVTLADLDIAFWAKIHFRPPVKVVSTVKLVESHCPPKSREYAATTRVMATKKRATLNNSFTVIQPL